MATISLVPKFEKKNKDGESIIRIRISVSGKPAFRSTGQKTTKGNWDKKEHLLKTSAPNADVVNAILRKKKREAEEELLQLELRDGKVDINKIRSKAVRRASPDFHVYSKDLVEDLKKKFVAGSIKGYNTTLRKIKKFSPELLISDINPLWLRKFETSLLEDDLSTNTVTAHWKRLKRIVNSAMKDGVDMEYPFRKYDNPKYRNPIRVYLTPGEITKWEKALLKPLSENMLRVGNYFLLGCHSGLRISDWLRFNPAFISGERLILYAKKNGEIVSMKMHDRLKEVINRIKDSPLTLDHVTVNYMIDAIKTIAKIDKHITAHTARHTFGTQCAERGIPISACAEFMGISERTCKVYYRITGTLLDKEIDKFNEPEIPQIPPEKPGVE